MRSYNPRLITAACLAASAAACAPTCQPESSAVMSANAEATVTQMAGRQGLAYYTSEEQGGIRTITLAPVEAVGLQGGRGAATGADTINAAKRDLFDESFKGLIDPRASDSSTLRLDYRALLSTARPGYFLPGSYSQGLPVDRQLATARYVDGRRTFNTIPASVAACVVTNFLASGLSVSQPVGVAVQDLAGNIQGYRAQITIGNQPGTSPASFMPQPQRGVPMSLQNNWPSQQAVPRG